MAETLKFFDLKKKKSFTTSKYTLKTVKGRHMAIATAPSGCKAYRIVAKKK